MYENIKFEAEKTSFFLYFRNCRQMFKINVTFFAFSFLNVPHQDENEIILYAQVKRSIEELLFACKFSHHKFNFLGKQLTTETLFDVTKETKEIQYFFLKEDEKIF